ncbi:DNA-binding domain-containing protein [Endozoicomonas sp. SM1973]|uniref:DNA-binding domain-containing protein n=1 Tax=Spartinivicinus marinus TaxID=2994442 RepID=A0A853IF54_9GAMM|nr:DNA-binding domain-containing protein [Spartinivicinus marinus]MCX4030152.1 DNA-binding domain-containing protein [Spartinivicinus marinus]NYZ67795.1 DNA-binding domain-containing protein [Spartinivicinus marinus]
MLKQVIGWIFPKTLPKPTQELSDDVKHCLVQLDRLAGVPKEYFNQYYLSPIKKWDQLASIDYDHNVLVAKLEVILKVLRRMKGAILPHGVRPEMIKQKQYQWQYGIFVAALIYDSHKHLALPTNEDAALTGLLPIKHTTLLIEGNQNKNVLFIKQLFTGDPLEWVQEDEQLITTLIKAINDPFGEPMIGESLVFAYQLIHENKATPKPVEPDIISEVPIKAEQPHSVEPTENKPKKPELSLKDIGNEFIEWVISEVNRNNLTVNKPDSLVYEPRYGLALLTPDIFKLYESKKGVPYMTTQKGLLKLKIHASISGSNTKKGHLPNRFLQATYILINSPEVLERIEITKDEDKELVG